MSQGKGLRPMPPCNDLHVDQRFGSTEPNVADPKPARRVKATGERWAELRILKVGQCRICRDAFGLTLHHLVPRSLGGDDVPNNLVPLCGSGTTGCHGDVEHRDPVALSLLRLSLTEDELAYLAAKKGPEFVDRYYPALRLEAA